MLSSQIVDGFWATTGDPLNWLKANINLALKNPGYSDEISKFIGKLSLR